MTVVDDADDQVLLANTHAQVELRLHSLEQAEFMCFKQDGASLYLLANLYNY